LWRKIAPDAYQQRPFPDKKAALKKGHASLS